MNGKIVKYVHIHILALLLSIYLLNNGVVMQYHISISVVVIVF